MAKSVMQTAILKPLTQEEYDKKWSWLKDCIPVIMLRDGEEIKFIKESNQVVLNDTTFDIIDHDEENKSFTIVKEGKRFVAIYYGISTNH